MFCMSKWLLLFLLVFWEMITRKLRKIDRLSIHWNKWVLQNKGRKCFIEFDVFSEWHFFDKLLSRLFGVLWKVSSDSRNRDKCQTVLSVVTDYFRVYEWDTYIWVGTLSWKVPGCRDRAMWIVSCILTLERQIGSLTLTV